MFVAKKEEMAPVAQSHALYTRRCLFFKWVTCGNGMARNQPKQEFWTKSSGLGLFVVKKEETVRVAQTHALYTPNATFPNGSREATKWHETTPNMSFGRKVVDWACSLRKKKKWFQWHKLMRCTHRNARFPNGSRPATKWRDTTPNMSFGPKVVDWACSLRKKKEMVPVAQTHALYTP